MRQTLLIIAGLAFATAPAIPTAPAFSEPLQPQVVAIVSTSDLDLFSANGRRQLDLRLVHAAHEVCDTASNVDRVGENEAGKCRADVLARARARTAELTTSSQRIAIAAR